MTVAELPKPVELDYVDPDQFEALHQAAIADNRCINFSVHPNDRHYNAYDELLYPISKKLNQNYSQANIVSFTVLQKIVRPGHTGAEQRASLWHIDKTDRYEREIIVSNIFPTQFLSGLIQLKQIEYMNGQLSVASPGVTAKSLPDDNIVDSTNGHKLTVEQSMPFCAVEIPKNGIHRSPVNPTDMTVNRMAIIAKYQVAI
jgi:hypothetical protein